jgi:hypothetical protein
MDQMNQVNNPPIYGQHLPALPGATLSLVMGILSLVLCWCYGPPGLILSIIGLVMGNKAQALHQQSPGEYSESSFKNAIAGKTCSIIGLVYGVLWIIFWVLWAVIFGAMYGGTLNILDFLNNLQ